MLSDEQVRAHIGTLARAMRKEPAPGSPEEKDTLKAACALAADLLETGHAIAQQLGRIADRLESIEDMRGDGSVR